MMQVFATVYLMIGTFLMMVAIVHRPRWMGPLKFGIMLWLVFGWPYVLWLSNEIKKGRR